MFRLTARASSILIALSISLFAQQAALAAPILPGGLDVLPGSNYAATVIQETNRIIPLMSFGTEIGTVTLHDRITSTGGTINFERYLLNTGNTSLSSPTLTSTGFSGFSTDVDYDNTSKGSSHPLIALRSSTLGDEITFDKFSAFTLAPNDNTYYMTTKTNALGYAATGTTTLNGIINGQYVSGSVTTYAPTAIPEPTTLSLVGLSALSLLSRRRRV